MVFLLAPLALGRGVEGRVTTDDALQALGHGTLLVPVQKFVLPLGEGGVPELCHAPLLVGLQGELTEWEFTEHVVQALDRPPVSHTDHRAVNTWQLHDFQLQLVNWDRQGSLTLVAPAPVPGEILLDGSVRIEKSDAHATKKIDSGGLDYDPKQAFFGVPADSLYFTYQGSSAVLSGNFSILLEHVEFEVLNGGERLSFQAGTMSSGPPTPVFSESHTHLFVLNVTQSRLDTTMGRAQAILVGPSVDASWEGSLLVSHATGSVETGSGVMNVLDEDLKVADDFDARIARLAGDGAIEAVLVPETSHAEAASSGADPILPAPGRAAVWISVAALLVVAAFVGAVLAHRRAARPSGPEAPVPAPGSPGSRSLERLTQLERQLKVEPGNLALAMELGLTYAQEGRPSDALPLLLMATRSFPKSDMPRYYAALSLLKLGRTLDAIQHLEYAFRLNPLNLARFLKEGPLEEFGAVPEVRRLLNQWALRYREADGRGYA